MSEIEKICLRYVCYAGLLVMSLVLQTSHPEMFAILCTPLPIGNLSSPQQGLDLPLNRPVVTDPATAE